jgi:hypothetical protein
MTFVPNSGPVNTTQINAAFGLGEDINLYKGVQWFYPGNLTTGFFSTNTIKMSDFFGKQGTDPATAGSFYANAVSRNTGNISAPLYRNTLKIEVWGGGGSGGGGNGGDGSKGGDSSILGVTAGGGAGGKAGNIPQPAPPVCTSTGPCGRGGRCNACNACVPDTYRATSGPEVIPCTSTRCSPTRCSPTPGGTPSYNVVITLGGQPLGTPGYTAYFRCGC